MSTLYNALSHLHSEVSGIWAFGYIGHLLWDTLLFGALMLGPHNRAAASLVQMTCLTRSYLGLIPGILCCFAQPTVYLSRPA